MAKEKAKHDGLLCFLLALIVVLILVIGGGAYYFLVVDNCNEYEGEYQKVSYQEDNLITTENIISLRTRYEILENIDEYEEFLAKIKSCPEFENATKKYNKSLFEQRNLIAIKCSKIHIQEETELLEFYEEGNVVNATIYIDDATTLARNAGDIYFVPISKSITSANIEYERPSRINSGMRDDKPIIYLYPTEETAVSVKLGNPEKITCSYPKYVDGWNVIAKPDGTLTYTETGRELYSLYWQGKDANDKMNSKEGFVVKGEDTIRFLEEKLEILGLNQKEAEEFIIYWLPKMESNKYNYIRFASMEEIEEYMPLEINPKPDTIIRILMEFKGLDKYIEIPEQKLETTTREGFVAVEWGGTELK
ncbi:MAG: hypothetical protein IKT41_02640 [Clostridia bacterium]|nr:hypothetical protein [Clostridia bacterium]